MNATFSPLTEFKNSQIKYLFTDIDDTITTHGQLPANSYQKLWDLKDAGIEVIPITGRPAGWCDMIARFWPVRAVIGENGAFYFSYENKKMKRVWAYGDDERAKHQKNLDTIKLEVLKQVPGAAVSADQFSRLFDLAIDFCEDIPPLPPKDIERIVKIFTDHGAQAKVSSIHVNGWFGAHDKLSMCKTFCKNELQIDPQTAQDQIAFSGDSPNDEPMFAFFKNSFGVANIKAFKAQLKNLPTYITDAESAQGFTQLADRLISLKQAP